MANASVTYSLTGTICLHFASMKFPSLVHIYRYVIIFWQVTSQAQPKSLRSGSKFDLLFTTTIMYQLLSDS